jgi:hypothetical protein
MGISQVYLQPQFDMRAVDQQRVDKTIVLSDHYNGTITVSFNAFKSGMYLVVVELKKSTLTGCPVYQVWLRLTTAMQKLRIVTAKGWHGATETGP